MAAPAPRLGDIEALTRLLDDRFRIPGTSIRLGLDGLIGLVPGVGDVAATLLSLYVVARARNLGVPTGVLAMMLGNVLLDTAVGAVPLLGDVFDIAFKANRRNLDLLKRTLERRATGDPDQPFRRRSGPSRASQSSRSVDGIGRPTQ